MSCPLFCTFFEAFFVLQTCLVIQIVVQVLLDGVPLTEVDVGWYGIHTHVLDTVLFG